MSWPTKDWKPKKVVSMTLSLKEFVDVTMALEKVALSAELTEVQRGRLGTLRKKIIRGWNVGGAV